MRHFSYHVAEIGVAYRENIAEVKEAMQQAFELLQKTDHGENILDALEMHGITAFGDSAITVRARIKTLPGKQWAIGRAYNEIIKEVFDARGIEIPFPHMTLYMGEDKQGNAPPLNLRGVRRQPPPPPAEPVRLPEAGAPVAEEEGEQRAPK
jgi:small conductance mechanosensitive channel